jgi:hypothetical protein
VSCVPIAQRAGKRLGCYIVAKEDVGTLPNAHSTGTCSHTPRAWRIVPQGPPMMLSATGTSERRSLVLILHDSSQPMTTPAPDWNPQDSRDREVARESAALVERWLAG